MIKRFDDLLELEQPHLLNDSLCVDVTTVSLYLQEGLMDMKRDSSKCQIFHYGSP